MGVNAMVTLNDRLGAMDRCQGGVHEFSLPPSLSISLSLYLFLSLSLSLSLNNIHTGLFTSSVDANPTHTSLHAPPDLTSVTIIDFEGVAHVLLMCC